MYGSQVWGSTSLMNIKKLQVFQNKQLMHIVNAPWYVRRKVIHDDLKIEPISEFIKKTSTRFFNKIPQIGNELLQTQAYDPAPPVQGNVLELLWMRSLLTCHKSKDLEQVQLLPIWVFKFFLNFHFELC
ncbi:hypothetical protein AVEN_194009-1 [Araneus ventricosus]|uniref:Uncharacterized protein n=1 Tax=Araneus ventricosus TaxID=182803 RepID=A0A4Y2LAL9_ARAVE|nr:hypothetical protein AVEN_194009-1 [Araneus ventricosus]